MPNRTIGSEIIPGPFYVMRVDDNGKLCDLTSDDVEKYTALFSVPETFAPGHWDVHTKVDETKNTCIIHIISEWVVDQK